MKITRNAAAIVALYMVTVVAINIGFAHYREYALVWSMLAGSIFVTRDFAQRAIGHWVWLPMAATVAISYAMASPRVAAASAAAFAASELVDWVVYTASRKPLHHRILISSSISVPLDSLIFLSMMGLLSPSLMMAQVSSKMVAAIVVAGCLWGLSGRPR